jgi:multiple sugar transport system permease protein
MAGYAFARGDFFAKQFLFTIFLGIIMMPGIVRMVPLFIIMARLHLVNTYWALILPHATSIFGTFMLRQYYSTIPRDYDDAALLDGASVFQIYYKVLLPQIKPALATLGTLIFLGQWNDFMYPLIITSRMEMRTLTVGLATMVREEGAAGLEMAGAVLSFLPTFVLYLFAQRHLIRGIALSGLKG